MKTTPEMKMTTDIPPEITTTVAGEGVIRRHLVIERGGMRFGIFGLLGKEAQFYTTGAGAVTFSDAIETAKEMVRVLREIKEWQAIMDHLRGLPVKSKGELPTIPVDERAAEVRAIKVG
jgi:5'-nucleotidase